MIWLDKTAAMRELIERCEPNAEPAVTVSELERTLDKYLTAHWAPNTVYAAGVFLIPELGKENGHKYQVTIAGTSGSSVPTNWSTIDAGRVESGTMTMIESGTAGILGYDMDAACWEVWNKKMAKASQFMKTPGIDMSGIFTRCKEMRDSFDSVLVA